MNYLLIVGVHLFSTLIRRGSTDDDVGRYCLGNLRIRQRLVVFSS